MAGKIPDGIKRIATSTQLRGFAYLLPHPPKPTIPPDQSPPPPLEGPTVIVHGLTADIPGVPHHYLTLLEAAHPQEISVGRMGALNAQIEILVGKCVIVCRDAQFKEVTDPVPSQGGHLVKFPIELSEHNPTFRIIDFPKEPAKVLYIRAELSVAVFLVTKSNKNAHHDHGKPVPPPSTDPYSGPPTIMCSSGCPHQPIFGGEPT